MSLNRYEQAVFDYWDRHIEERRHWQAKVAELTRVVAPAGEQARALERELWEYLVERSHQVAALRELRLEGVRRVSLLNLADHVIRLWGPPPKPRRPDAQR
jgi:hypothetical protein